MPVPENLYKNIRYAADKAWHHLMQNERLLTVKKTAPREPWDQAFYKAKKLLTGRGAPGNVLIVCDALTKEAEWHAGVPIEAKPKVQGKPTEHVDVKVRVEITGVEAENWEQVNAIFAKLTIPSPGHPLAELTITLIGRHFYDAGAAHDCPRLAAAVREKYGENYYGRAHKTGSPPSQALDLWFLKKQWKASGVAKLEFDDFINVSNGWEAFIKEGYWKEM